MIKIVLTVAGLCAAIYVLWAFSARGRFLLAVARLEKAVQTAKPRAGTLPGPRQDLPPEVLALALRLGVRTDAEVRFVSLQQAGEMWSKPGGKSMVFQARQSNSLLASNYVWLAAFAPLSLVTAVDYTVSGEAGLEVRLGGAIPLIRTVGTEEINRGEMMRYLLELPWMPDAILYNHDLDWRVIDSHTLVVGHGFGANRAAVTLHLNRQGLIESGDAPSRPAQEGNRTVERPWGGRMWDYEVHNGRTIPMQGEAYWMIDGKRFVYWRGRITSWSAS